MNRENKARLEELKGKYRARVLMKQIPMLAALKPFPPSLNEYVRLLIDEALDYEKRIVESKIITDPCYRAFKESGLLETPYNWHIWKRCWKTAKHGGYE